jgi:acyl-CoA-binding domain-containing protein 6
MFDLTGRAKWDSWDSIGKTYENRTADVEARYIQIARDLGWNGITSGSSVPAQAPQPQDQKEETYEDLDHLPDDPGKGRSGRDGGMGVSVSVMADSSDDGDEEVEASLHGHALSGEVESLTALADQGADVNKLDEFVRFIMSLMPRNRR